MTHSKKIEEAIDEAHIQVSLEKSILESVNRELDFKKRNGQVVDFKINQIKNDNGDFTVDVTLQLNKPIDNIKIDFKIDEDDEFSYYHNY